MIRAVMMNGGAALVREGAARLQSGDGHGYSVFSAAAPAAAIGQIPSRYRVRHLPKRQP